MTKRIGVSVVGSLFVLGALLVWQRQTSAQNQAAPAVHEIKMTVKKYEYSPAEIHVKQGEKVRLLITALDRKHGIELKEFNVKSDLEEKKETPVEFVASKAGTFEFKCSVYCGIGHGRVKGKLIVE